MRAKKHLGQHFLTSKKALVDIVNASKISKDDTVLEIGPGKGVLTEALLASAKKVVAIEKDTDLIPLLEERFASNIKDGSLVIIQKDILEVDVSEVIQGNYKLVANIPYYITGLLFRKFLESDHQPTVMTVLVQKEVADRVVARDGKESILSHSVKIYGTPSVVAKVPARYFRPAPKVDSAILLVENISKDALEGFSEEQFFQVLKTAFAHKRKLLVNNLELLFPKTVIDDCFVRCSVPKNSRAESLTRESLVCVTRELHK